MGNGMYWWHAICLCLFFKQHNIFAQSKTWVASPTSYGKMKVVHGKKTFPLSVYLENAL